MKAREVDSKQQATASQPPNLSISQALTSKKTDVLTSERSIRNEALEQRLSAQSVACCPLLKLKESLDRYLFLKNIKGDNALKQPILLIIMKGPYLSPIVAL